MMQSIIPILIQQIFPHNVTGGGGGADGLHTDLPEDEQLQTDDGEDLQMDE